MSVLKIGSMLPAPAVTPSLPPLRGAEEKEGGRSGTAKSIITVGARAPQDYEDLSAKGVQKAASLNQDAHQHHVEEVVKKINDALEAFGTTSLKLTYDRERQLIIMQVVKIGEQAGRPEEVIRQIPPEELLDLTERLEELQGLLFDRQV
jgi:uncharacterized FlaG/YvyC family protein